MSRWKCIIANLLFTIGIVSPAWAETSVSLSETPPDFKIAFIGDQGLGKNADKSIWRICSWHQNMHLMQVGKQKDATGWDVYEEARKGGAIIATAHDHSYGHTYLMNSFVNQTIASYSNCMIITEGQTFAFVSGLAGTKIYDQKVHGPWWARIYTNEI